MYAIEFQTIVDKPYIEIPEFEKFKGKKVKIILLKEENKEENKKSEADFIEYLANHPLKLEKNVKFLSREEAHER